MADKNTPLIGFVGLGSMGLGMAKNLLKHGHKVTGVDPSAPAREAFAAAGGAIAATPAEAAASADVVIIAVVNAQQVETVLYGEGGAAAALRKGGLVMQCATVPPAFAKSLGERLAKSGHDLLDAPMSGGRARAESGELTFMASGAAKAGADTRAVYEVISASAGNSWMFGNRVPHMLDDDYSPLSAIEIFVKDLGLVLSTGHEHRLPLPMAAAAHQLFLAAAGAGWGRLDDAAVVKVYEQAGDFKVSSPRK